ncbi:HD family phosphohydrolase [Leptolyngbya sp. FACHB-261]|uniref:HD family phosphohydrolase n=1 Tax=Leptolyngbya sp. FACHB-261 TaxID=2692806 RepID=UPI001683BBCA|nr:HD family phosphohydrolase [Leptolyngbya sp. FACHB-261]MBD2102929.1 GAF domain-containing protein [Leptolyngbya sp. FACHB-261]
MTQPLSCSGQPLVDQFDAGASQTSIGVPQGNVISSNHLELQPRETVPSELADLELESSERAALIERLLAIGMALSSAPDLETLLRLILTKSREITNSDAGSVYLVDRSDLDDPRLIFKIAQNDSQPSLSFEEVAIPLTQTSLAGYVAMTGESLNIPDAYSLSPELPYQINPAFDRSNQYRTRSLLVLPMQNQEREIIGVLQLINRKAAPHLMITPETAHQSTLPYSRWEERIIRCLASQAAISIERNHLQQSIENLFEGFVRASVQIIEARDPCTSGHSERVAELTVRLAQEVNEVGQGRLRIEHFDERQLQEIRYAALLHDFGKVGVPEAILAKEKKLYPHQLEVIRYRFALAQRTLELDCAHTRLAHLVTDQRCPACAENLGAFDQKLNAELERLEHYWQVLVEANEPRVLAAESVSQRHRQLHELAQYCFRGINNESQALLSELELEQLLVNQGNLTHAEREAVQAHVSHTYEFLKRIPWTRTLQQVPEIAYGHHEKLDGSGYPLGLQANQISLQTQMMTVADIYDALAAGDRPYKQGLTLERTLGILHEEANQSRLNADLVELFVQRRVFEVVGHCFQ